MMLEPELNIYVHTVQTATIFTAWYMQYCSMVCSSHLILNKYVLQFLGTYIVMLCMYHVVHLTGSVTMKGYSMCWFVQGVLRVRVRDEWVCEVCGEIWDE